MPIYSAEEFNKEYGHAVERHPLPTDCATSNYPRVLHDEKTWRFLQRVFYEQSYARSSYHHRLMGRHENLWYSGVDDYYVQAWDDVAGRGRGLYAVRDIPAGTKVWYFNEDWVVNDGFWDTKQKMTAYLERLPHDLQCDVLLWAYAAAPVRKGMQGSYVECNLDEASFINHAEHPDLVNVMVPQNIAARDIKEGEELLMDYSSFISLGEEAIPWWDEIRNTAWQETEAQDMANYDSDTDATSQANRSSSSPPSVESIEGGADPMDEYVKYGAPKVKASTTTTGTVFVDARSIDDTRVSSCGYFPASVSFFLALVVARGLVSMGMRRRR